MLSSVYVLILVGLEVESAFNPVVLVPGLGANQLEAKLDKAKSEHFWCWRHSDWYTIWMSVIQMELSACMIDNLMLDVNENDGSTTNREGVSIRVPGFGHTDTVEWLDPFCPLKGRFFGYYVDLVKRLIAMDYVRNVSVRGAPYDFRKAPNELADYMNDLTDLIEETYKMNGNKRVVIIGHSLGGNVALYFLQRKAPEWKDKYVSAFITISAPLAGTAKALKLIASGDSLGYPKILLDPIKFRGLQRSFVTVIWSMPLEDHWADDEVLVETPFRNYTARDYKQFFKDVDYEKGFILRQNTKQLIRVSQPPGVRTYCLYSLNSKEITPASYVYGSTKRGRPWYDQEARTLLGPGDGTVNKRSLRACRAWPTAEVLEFSDIIHRDTVSDERIINAVEKIIRSLTS